MRHVPGSEAVRLLGLRATPGDCRCVFSGGGSLVRPSVQARQFGAATEEKLGKAAGPVGLCPCEGGACKAGRGEDAL